MISPQRSINSIQRVGTPKDLRKDYTTIIKKPDKANCVVTVSELDYLNKMKQLISDQPTFKKLRHNSMKSREDSLIAYLLKLRQDNIIDDATLQKILPSASHPGVLYSLPKLHKSGCPFRCIVSSINTYNYNHASYLVCLLKHVSTNQFTIKDSPSLLNGLWHTATTTSSCALLMLCHCSPMFHLMRQLKLVKTNYMPRLIRLSYLALPLQSNQAKHSSR